jgi:hypothetical protein
MLRKAHWLLGWCKRLTCVDMLEGVGTGRLYLLWREMTASPAARDCASGLWILELEA